MPDLLSLPDHLSRPHEDGAADHLLGMRLPSVTFPAAGGGSVSLDGPDTHRLVLYVPPRMGGPGAELSDDRDMIPGARGCTPQNCAFTDDHAELVEDQWCRIAG